MLETAWESRWLPDSYGGVAQLGEHLPCKQGVKSSNLSISIRRSESRGVVLKRMHFENRVLSVACRHAKIKYFDLLTNASISRKSNHLILHTYLENRILKNYDKSFKREISKTSEAHRKMRKKHRKM